MRVLLLARYGKLPAPSRYRFYQYIPYLQASGLEFDVAPLLSDGYVRRQYAERNFPLGPLPGIYLRRVADLLKAGKYDLVWLEKEAMPWIPAWFEFALGLSRVPYVVDYDDACYHTYDQSRNAVVRRVLGKKIAILMRRANMVIVGNNYLADYARAAGAKRVEFLPSVVDINKYPVRGRTDNEVFTIGWIGAPANSRHLESIKGALEEVCRDARGRVRVVGGWHTSLPKSIPVEYRPWSEDSEVAEMQQFDVGIMPLYDGPWERGKCGLKLINYMAAGLPTVASPVGVNKQIVEHGRTGFLAFSDSDWVRALTNLRDDVNLRKSMGAEGRLKVERAYCVQVTAQKLAAWLKEASRLSNSSSTRDARFSSIVQD